jgi:phage terminase small subunit
MALTPKQKRFADEYLVDLNATAAAVRAGLGPKGGFRTRETAAQAGHVMLTNADVAEYVTARQAEMSEQLSIDAKTVIKLYWDIATADASEIVSGLKRPCRHCYGIGFAYQWKSEAEYAEAYERELLAAERDKRLPVLPDCSGGFEYDWRLAPNQDCPQCEGEGRLEVRINDTSRLTGKARRLFAGIKQTRLGTEVKMRDQDGALRAVAAHLGITLESFRMSDPSNVPYTADMLAELGEDELEALEAARLKLDKVRELATAAVGKAKAVA